MAYAEAYKNVTKPFVKNDPRRINKPVGAREKQITSARKLLARAAKMTDVQKAIFDIDITGLTELDAIYLIQMEKAKLGDKDAFKACMDYSGYKPSEHVEFSDVTEPLKDEDRKESIRLRMLALQKGEESTVETANTILQEQENI